MLALFFFNFFLESLSLYGLCYQDHYPNEIIYTLRIPATF